MAVKPRPFADSLEHILAEMKRLDLMLRRAVLVARQARSSDVPDEFRGLVITEDSVDQMLGSVDFLGDSWNMTDSVRETATEIDQQLEHHQEEIRARMEESSRAGIRLALAHLATTYDLSPAEVDILLIALAPELEPRYETLYAYLHNDVTRNRPSVNLCLDLICRTQLEKIQARELFSPVAPLLKFHFIELHEGSYDRSPTLLRQFLKIDDTISGFLLERQPRKTLIGEMIVPASGIAELETSAGTRSELQNMAQALANGRTDRTIIQLWGENEAPLLEAAEALAFSMNKPLLYVDLSALKDDSSKLTVLVRDASLLGTLLVVNRAMSDTTETERENKNQIEETLWVAALEGGVPLILLNPSEQFGLFAQSVRLWRVHVDPPDFDTRREAWLLALNGWVADIDPDRLADLFPFSAKHIQQATSLAFARATLRNPSDPSPLVSDVLDAGRDLTTPNLRRYTILIKPKFGWGDLILPEDRLRELRSVVARVRFRSIVHRDWDFGQKLARNRGLSVLFAGASGCGKTMAAEVLANELSLHLFQIDLSTVVSKYIGDTERNLSNIFREAELSQSLLFFDEADALFGKRTEVTDAHDRYANIEVNYLLQRIEQYQGLVILATNFQKNIDEAFLRRLHHVIEFPFPDERARALIWKLHFTDKVPRDPDIDFQFLANHFKLSGAEIRNVVLEAAFLAAEERGVEGQITMGHIIEAVKHVHNKQGKLLMKSDLGPYSRAS